MTILAIETSCDETAAAVIRREAGAPYAVIDRSVVASQAALHAKYGGVYPEVASREHSKQILPVISEALNLPVYEAGRLPHSNFHGIDYLAVTHGPGLIGSLLVGTHTAAGISLATGIPLLPVNHLAGHIYASFIRHGTETDVPQFPLIALIVSGGHTLLVRMKQHHEYQLLGQTLDDAAGEAFDKVAKLLDLGYPGGPEISKLAVLGDRQAYPLPIGLMHEETLDFSFSGLKTAVLRVVQRERKPLSPSIKANIAASFERVAIESLLLKTAHALDKHPVSNVILGGGVAANSYLRQRMGTLLAHRIPSVTLHVPQASLCTDNAAVIGGAAAFSPLVATPPHELKTHARLSLASNKPA